MLASIMSGCVTYPFIDESVAYIESNPLAAEFPAPAYELVETPDPGADMLLGTWIANYTEITRVTDGRPTNPMHDYFKNTRWPFTVRYTFNSDGSFTRHEVMRYWMQRETTQQTHWQGRWTYEDGVLTLVVDNGVVESEGMFSPNRHAFDVPDGADCKTSSYRVAWLESGEIILRDVDTLKQTGSTRVTVEVDAKGVRTERTICLHGGDNGRERGEIIEKATLVRFRKDR